jgi:hypothetical protein
MGRKSMLVSRLRVVKGKARQRRYPRWRFSPSSARCWPSCPFFGFLRPTVWTQGAGQLHPPRRSALKSSLSPTSRESAPRPVQSKRANPAAAFPPSAPIPREWLNAACGAARRAQMATAAAHTKANVKNLVIHSPDQSAAVSKRRRFPPGPISGHDQDIVRGSGS